MTIRNIDPKNPQDDCDIVTSALLNLLRETTTTYIDTIKPETFAFTPEQYHGIYNAVLNYFHHTIDLLVQNIAVEHRKEFLEDVDTAFHHILNHLLDDVSKCDGIKH